MERKRRLPDSLRKPDEPNDAKRECVQSLRRLYTRIPLSHVYKTFNDLRLKNLMHDRVIRTNDNREIPAHAIVLSMASPYFQRELSATGNDGDTNASRINIDLPEEIMQQVISITYTGHCKITPENVRPLLVAGSTFYFQEVVHKCYEFILNELNPENCLDYFKFSKLYFLNELTGNIMKYILCHFREVYRRNNQFLELTADELLSIVEHDELNVVKEETLFECVVRWIEHDCQEREHHLLSLVKLLRFGTMDITYFKKTIMRNHYMKNNPDVNQYLNEVKDKISHYIYEDDSENVSTILAQSRIPQEVLFVIGGWSGSPQHNYTLMEVYDNCARHWFPIKQADVAIELEFYYHGVCVVNELVYMLGGCSDSLMRSTTNRVRCFNARTVVWEDRANMYDARSNGSYVELNGFMYAIGGVNQYVHLDTVERYDPVNNQWTIIASINDARTEASAASLHGKIYVAGGFAVDEVLRSVECYDPVTNLWTMITPMVSPRHGLCLVAYRDALYALGGNDGLSHVDTMERYAPATAPYWVGVAGTRTRRKDFAAVVLDNKIYAIGGMDEWSTVSWSESYDGDTNEWTREPRMTQRRSGLSACVLGGLDNARDYSYNTYKERVRSSQT